MKKNMKYVFLTGLVALGVAAVSVYSCEKETIVPNTESTSKKPEVLPAGDICGKMMNKSIVKFHNMESDAIGKVYGEALIYNDTKYFYVELKSNDKNIYLTDAYMEIAKSPATIPTGEDMDAVLRQFKYHILNRPAAISRKFRVPLNELRNFNLIAVATKFKHMNNGSAESKDSGILWISGDRINNSSEGFAFDYKKQVCETVDGVEQTSDQTDN
jgi:hypothetical protein